jgi:IS30 family transposase
VARLRIDYPDDPMMHVSHGTIYQSLYMQERGNCAGSRPSASLKVAQIAGERSPTMVMNSERPGIGMMT